MKFNLYAGDECVGWSELPWADPPMGVVSGPFQPNDNYKKIQPTIREFHLHDGSLGDRNDNQLQEVMQKIRALALQVRAETGEVLLPVEGVHLTDFSEELEGEAIEITVLGLSNEQFEQFWPNADEEYEKHFQQSV